MVYVLSRISYTAKDEGTYTFFVPKHKLFHGHRALRTEGFFALRLTWRDPFC